MSEMAQVAVVGVPPVESQLPYQAAVEPEAATAVRVMSDPLAMFAVALLSVG
jgi:hypothetical protein